MGNLKPTCLVSVPVCKHHLRLQPPPLATSTLVADTWHSQSDINERIFERLNSQELLLNQTSVALKELSSRIDNLHTQFCTVMEATSVLLDEIHSSLWTGVDTLWT